MYYYFVSTLPTIFFDGNMPFSIDEFRADCERLLSGQDYLDARIAIELDEGNAQNKMLQEWQRFDRSLRNEAIFLRAPQVKKNPVNEMRGQRDFDLDVMQIVGQAAKMENLLEGEKLILQLKWKKLDELSLNRDFEIDYILAYAVKLKMLDRLNAFKTDEGAKMLEKIMEYDEHRESSFVKREA